MSYQHGFDKKTNNFSYWSTTSCNSTPWFPQMFSRNRFQLILKFFHFVDNSKLTTPVDPCAKFQPLSDHANRLFRHFYIPYQQLSIDESLVGTKSHTYFTYAIPSKKATPPLWHKALGDLRLHYKLLPWFLCVQRSKMWR